MRYRRLGATDLELSLIGFGASPLGDEFGPVDAAEAERAVHVALDRGINFFDVSPFYGRTVAETRLGAALAGRRMNAVLSTKCGRYGPNEFDYTPVTIRRSVDESLGRLRTDYVDMLIAHDIEFGNREQIISETIPAMRDIQKDGKARYIGISGYPLGVLADVAVRSRVDFVLSYCHYNLLNRTLDRFLTPLALYYGFGLINASPLHMGLLTESGPPPWHPAPTHVKDAGRKIVELCARHNINVAALALYFCLKHPHVASTLVGMSSQAQVLENLIALEMEPAAELQAEIEQLIAPVSEACWQSGRTENADAQD